MQAIVDAFHALKEGDEPEEKRGKAIACTLHDGHCYRYRSARCLATWHVREGVTTDRSKLQQEVKSVLPPLVRMGAVD